jgi:hypothetical protein
MDGSIRRPLGHARRLDSVQTITPENTREVVNVPLQLGWLGLQPVDLRAEGA